MGAAGQSQLQPRRQSRLMVLRLMQLLPYLLWLLWLLPLLAVHVRHSPCRRRRGLSQRLVSQVRMVLMAARRLLRARQHPCASHTGVWAIVLGSLAVLGTNPPPSSRHAGSLMTGTEF